MTMYRFILYHSCDYSFFCSDNENMLKMAGKMKTDGNVKAFEEFNIEIYLLLPWDLSKMKVVVEHRIQSFIWIQHLWYSQKDFSKCLEIYVLSWGDPDPCEIDIGLCSCMISVSRFDATISWNGRSRHICQIISIFRIASLVLAF